MHAYILRKSIAEREITKCKIFYGRSLRYFSVLKEIAIMEEFRRLYSSFSASQNVLNAVCSNKNARTVQEILSSYYARERPKRIHRHELLKHFTWLHVQTDSTLRKEIPLFFLLLLSITLFTTKLLNIFDILSINNYNMLNNSFILFYLLFYRVIKLSCNIKKY